MSVNRGKQFEDVIESAFEKIPNVSVVRLHDQTTGYLGSSNHCDFIVYKKPYEYHIECKSVHGNTLSIHSIPKPDKHGVLHGFYGNITDTQWEGLLEKSEIKGVYAGILCWWVDKDVTRFIPIQMLHFLREFCKMKSYRYDIVDIEDIELDYMYKSILIQGKKKRVFFDYDMEELLNEIPNWRCKKDW